MIRKLLVFLALNLFIMMAFAKPLNITRGYGLDRVVEIGPDSPFWGLDKAIDNSFVDKGNIAHERASEAHKMIEKNNTEAAQRAIRDMNRVAEQATNKSTKGLQKAERVLQQVKQRTPAAANLGIDHAIENVKGAQQRGPKGAPGKPNITPEEGKPGKETPGKGQKPEEPGELTQGKGDNETETPEENESEILEVNKSFENETNTQEPSNESNKTQTEVLPLELVDVNTSLETNTVNVENNGQSTLYNLTIKKTPKSYIGCEIEEIQAGESRSTNCEIEEWEKIVIEAWRGDKTGKRIAEFDLGVSEIKEWSKAKKAVFNFNQYSRSRHLKNSYLDKTRCEGADPVYSILDISVPFSWNKSSGLWEGYQDFPKKGGKIGLTCGIFPSYLNGTIEEILSEFDYTQDYIGYRTSSPPENLSCVLLKENFYCAKYYYFDKIVPVDLHKDEYTMEDMEELIGANVKDINCGFFSTNGLIADKNAFPEGPQKTLYEQGNVSYIRFTKAQENESIPEDESLGLGKYTTCIPEAKLSPEKETNILVTFAYSNSSIPTNIIEELKGSSVDKSMNYVADWYESEAEKYINQSVEVDFKFLDDQYEVNINISQAEEEYQLRGEDAGRETVAEEKFFHRKLIKPLKQRGVDFDNYDASLIVYDNPSLYSNGLWSSSGHADRHRGYAYINLGRFLTSSELSDYEAKLVIWTAAHELGHVFGTYDFSPSEGIYENKSCLMSGDSVSLSNNTLCSYKDVGWYDTDGDGIIEVTDPCPFDRENFCKS